MDSSMSIEGRIAIVSGAAGDIGGASALELARRGADVVMGDIADRDRAVDRIRAVEALGRRCHYTRVDVSDDSSVKRWVEEAEEVLGVPDIVVATAAVVTLKNLKEITFEEWRREFDVNLHGYFYLARTVANRLVEKKQPGRIVLIGSAAANGLTMALPTYCITKISVRKLAEALAIQYARNGIRVNDVSPGNVDAGLSAEIMRNDPSVRPLAESVVPIGELSKAEDIAYQVGHLCEPECHHITGSTLYVDGGMNLKVISDYGDDGM